MSSHILPSSLFHPALCTVYLPSSYLRSLFLESILYGSSKKHELKNEFTFPSVWQGYWDCNQNALILKFSRLNLPPGHKVLTVPPPPPHTTAKIKNKSGQCQDLPLCLLVFRKLFPSKFCLFPGIVR